MSTLDKLAKSFGTDKCSDNHNYCNKYEKYLPFKRYDELNILEIGVLDGKSLLTWKDYYYRSNILGIDINPDCKKYEEPRISVEIGSQDDGAFLSRTWQKYGPFDFILDDGSHQQHHIIDTFNFFYPKMHKNAVYMVEDLHTSYWPEYNGGLKKPNTFMEFTKDCLDKINARHSRGALVPDYITMETSSISIYDSIVCFEKGDVWWTEPLNRFDKTRF